MKFILLIPISEDRPELIKEMDKAIADYNRQAMADPKKNVSCFQSIVQSLLASTNCFAQNPGSHFTPIRLKLQQE